VKKDTSMTPSEQDKLQHPSNNSRNVLIRNTATIQERQRIAEFLLSERGRNVVLSIWKEDVTIFEAVAQAISSGAR
jgi:hypothetical protein